jgi:N6-adenosine-specific RNA methylase IME4
MPISAIKIGRRIRKDMGDIAELAARIKRLGFLLHPIVVAPDGELIAGARRLEAAKLAGLTHVPITVVSGLSDADKVLAEISENIDRKDFLPSEIDEIRRWTESQERAAAKQRMSAGGKGAKVSHPYRVTDRIGAFAGVSGRTVEKIKAVCEAAEQNPRKFGPIKEQMDATGKVDHAFKQIQIIVRQQEHAKLIEPGCTVDDLVSLAESGKRFGVIYADPPWPWETFGPRGRIRSCADHYYGLATITEIAALPVAALTMPDTALLMWGTWPRLPEVLDVIAAWGLQYKTDGFVWIKQNSSGGLHTGMGYYTRSNSEICLLATKGSPKRLAADVHQVVFAPVGEHSAKPEEVRRRIERLFAGPYLELYGRRKDVPGWWVWGNEVVPPVAEAAE